MLVSTYPFTCLQAEFEFGEGVFKAIGQEFQVKARSKRFSLSIYGEYGNMRWSLEDHHKGGELHVPSLIGRPVPEDFKKQNGNIADYCNRLDLLLAEALRVYLKQEETDKKRDDVW